MCCFPPSSMAPVFSLPLRVRAPTRAHDLALFLCPWTRLFASVCSSVKCGCVEPPGIPPCSAHGGLIWEGCSVLWVFTGGCGVTVVPGSWGGGTFSRPVPEHGKFHELSLLSGQRAPPSSCGQALNLCSSMVWFLPQCGPDSAPLTLGGGGQGVVDRRWQVAVSLWGLGVFCLENRAECLHRERLFMNSFPTWTVDTSTY